MIDTFKQHVPTEKFLADGRNFSGGNKSDYISYKEFVKYFSDLSEIKRHNLIIGINFSYGWMPTCFDFCPKKELNADEIIGEAVVILNAAKRGESLREEHITILKSCFNNSIVGASKLLHFINPNKFAIWDSRVYRYLTGREYDETRKGTLEAFLDYLEFCDFLTQRSSYNEIHSSIEEQVGYAMTKFRTAELIMYFGGAKETLHEAKRKTR